MQRNALRTGELVYLDSSALVKIFVDEPESRALTQYLVASPALASSALARVEVARAVRLQHGSMLAVERFLAGMQIMPLTDELISGAAGLVSASVRSLDAIHLAAASSLGSSLAALVTYDRRMAAAAAGLGLALASPGASLST